MQPYDLSHFQDRQEAIQAFDDLWKQESPWILAFNGVSGQGKSTLLNWLEVNRCLTNSMRFASLSIGDFISDLDTFLSRIIEARSANLDKDAARRFFEKRSEILADLNKRKFQLQQSQSSEGSPESQQIMIANVAEAIRGMENQSLSIIIEHWLTCIRTIPEQDKFVLLLDNYDVYQDLVSLDEVRLLWRTMERARQFLPNFRVIIASRERVQHQEHIESLKRGINGESLGDLSQADSGALLEAFGINDRDFSAAVFRMAAGHPLVTRMAAEAWKATPEGIKPGDVPKFTGREEAVNWLQTLIMNRLEEPLRSAARWMVVLRWFSFEALNAILETPITEEQYLKLTQYSFVVQSKLVEGYKAGHDLVRKVQIAHLQREQPEAFIKFHERAGQYFGKLKGGDLEKLYHQFYTAPEEAYDNWQELESQAAFNFDHQIWGLLFELALRDELSLPATMHAQILYRAGRRHYYRAEWFLAVEYYNEALKLFKDIGAKLGEANVRKSIGDVQQFRKELNAALESYNEALKLFKDIGDRLGEANVLQAIGDVQQFRDERDAALESYNEALKLFKDIGDRLGEANVLQSHGKLLIFSQKPEEGLKMLQDALNIYEEIDSIPSQANIYFFLGQILASNGQKDKSIELLQQAVELGNKIDPNHPVSIYMKAFLDKVKK